MTKTVDPVWGLKLSPAELERMRGVSAPSSSPTNQTFNTLDETAALSADDLKCFAEIREVLRKYNNLERFGVTLLHRHFDLQDNEILMETSNAGTRTMSLEPRILDTTDVTAIDTQWYLGQSMPLSLVKCRTSMHI